MLCKKLCKNKSYRAEVQKTKDHQATVRFCAAEAKR